MTLIELPLAPPAPDPGDEQLIARARRLAWVGIIWHIAEAAIAILAGLTASSIALLGFGADSAIEASAGLVVLWRFASARADDARAERRAQQLIAASFALLALYILLESSRALIDAQHPHTSWVGIALAAVTATTMPVLGRAKTRLGRELGSSATRSEGRQNLLCAYLSLALLVGLGANAAFGAWWLDSAAALIIAAAAAREARNSWNGEDCCTTPLTACRDDCCS